MHYVQNFLEFIIDFIFAILPIKKSHKVPRIVAHRGWHQDGLIENTIPAFKKALDAGLWGVEFDVRWTRDLVPVIHHDKNLKRVWGKNLMIADLDFSDLRQIQPEIPTLREVVEIFGKKIHFFIELKDEKILDLEAQNRILDETLSRLNPVDDFHLMALDYKIFKRFKLYSQKEVYVLVSIMNPKSIMKQAIENSCGAVTGHYLLVSKSIQKKLKPHEIVIGTGFIKTQNSMNRELNRGSEWVFTNHPNNLIL